MSANDFEINIEYNKFDIANKRLILIYDIKSVNFLDKNISNITSEYLIPEVIFHMIKENKIKMEVLKTDSKWYGVTYKKDKDEVVTAINDMIQEKIYKNNLWS